MKKSFFTLLLIGFVLISFAQIHSPELQEHIERGKQAYRKYADEAVHTKIKNQKEVKSYNVGDTKTFWNWSFAIMPPTWIETPATCRAVGELSYIFVADDQWNVNMNQDDVDLAMSFLEDSTLNTTEYGIVAMDTLFFGSIPDELDADPKVIFFFSALGQYNGSVFDGYFSAFNQMTEAEAQQVSAHSNECEMLYMSCDPVDPTSILTLSVLSHELQHLIHWGADIDEETWIDEGCAELAMVLFGQPDPITQFTSNPNNNLLSWDQQFSDYVQVMLFFTYLYEQFGADFIREIVEEQANSTTGIDNVLANNSIDATFTDIFMDWTLANFIDDISFADGQYGYELLDLPNFGYISETQYPVNVSSSMNNCANLYYKFSEDITTALFITFEAEDLENWDINLLCFDDNNDIQEIIAHEDYEIIFEQPPSPSYVLDKIILVVTNKNIGYETEDFSFSADVLSSVNETKKQGDNYLSVSPNPISENSVISVNIPTTENISIDIFDINGKLYENIFSGKLEAGKYDFQFNSQKMTQGIYFVKLKTENIVFIEKFIK